MPEEMPPPSVDECLSMMEFCARNARELRTKACMTRRRAEAVPRIVMAGAEEPSHAQLCQQADAYAQMSIGETVNALTASKMLDQALTLEQGD